MKHPLVGPISLGVLAFSFILGPVSLHGRGPSVGAHPYLECGTGAAGKARVVVIHILDAPTALHFVMTVEGRRLDNPGLLVAHGPSIRISIQPKVGQPSTCEANGPSPFHVRSTAARLADAHLLVEATAPVPFELQNARGKILATHTVDPAAGGPTTIGR